MCAVWICDSDPLQKSQKLLRQLFWNLRCRSQVVIEFNDCRKFKNVDITRSNSSDNDRSVDLLQIERPDLSCGLFNLQKIFVASQNTVRDSVCSHLHNSRTVSGFQAPADDFLTFCARPINRAKFKLEHSTLELLFLFQPGNSQFGKTFNAFRWKFIRKPNVEEGFSQRRVCKLSLNSHGVTAVHT